MNPTETSESVGMCSYMYVGMLDLLGLFGGGRGFTTTGSSVAIEIGAVADGHPEKRDTRPHEDLGSLLVWDVSKVELLCCVQSEIEGEAPPERAIHDLVAQIEDRMEAEDRKEDVDHQPNINERGVG
eukprot:GEZU01012596.1.p1 GENE.GEZU01012596.1~~GEZU01012596.1.p1  ORF type:complete len:127 (-),score=14.25 GEZU01012596.1:93-473(-)